MQYWNSMGANGKPVLHAESIAWIYKEQSPWFAYGFCMQISAADKTWDCLRINANPEPKLDADGAAIKNTDISQFTVEDLIFTGELSSAPVLAASDFIAGSVADTNQSITIKETNSFAKCENYGSEGKVWCNYGEPGESGMNLEWTRPFDTQDSQDVLLKLEEAGQTVKAFSYIYGWSAEPAEGASPDWEDFNWGVGNVSFVSQAFKDVEDAKAAEAAKVA